MDKICESSTATGRQATIFIDGKRGSARYLPESRASIVPKLADALSKEPNKPIRWKLPAFYLIETLDAFVSIVLALGKFSVISQSKNSKRVNEASVLLLYGAITKTSVIPQLITLSNFYKFNWLTDKLAALFYLLELPLCNLHIRNKQLRKNIISTIKHQQKYMNVREALLRHSLEYCDRDSYYGSRKTAFNKMKTANTELGYPIHLLQSNRLKGTYRFVERYHELLRASFKYYNHQFTGSIYAPQKNTSALKPIEPLQCALNAIRDTFPSSYTATLVETTTVDSFFGGQDSTTCTHEVKVSNELKEKDSPRLNAPPYRFSDSSEHYSIVRTDIKSLEQLSAIPGYKEIQIISRDKTIINKRIVPTPHSDPSPLWQTDSVVQAKSFFSKLLGKVCYEVFPLYLKLSENPYLTTMTFNPSVIKWLNGTESIIIENSPNLELVEFNLAATGQSFPNLKSLTVKASGVKRIDLFDGRCRFLSLETLQLCGNKIYRLELPTAKDILSKLIKLDLSDNDLQQFKLPSTKDILPQLKDINLSHNRLKQFEIANIEGIFPCLNHIDLSNNYLRQLVMPTKKNVLPSLVTLKIKNNKLQKLKVSNVMLSLQELILDNNEITQFELPFLPFLRILSLRSNRLSLFKQPSMRCDFNELSSIDLFGNKLKQIPGFSNIVTPKGFDLNLSYNIINAINTNDISIPKPLRLFILENPLISITGKPKQSLTLKAFFTPGLFYEYLTAQRAINYATEFAGCLVPKLNQYEEWAYILQGLYHHGSFRRPPYINFLLRFVIFNGIDDFLEKYIGSPTPPQKPSKLPQSNLDARPKPRKSAVRLGQPDNQKAGNDSSQSMTLPGFFASPAPTERSAKQPESSPNDEEQAYSCLTF